MKFVKRYVWWVPVIVLSVYGMYTYAAPCARPIAFTIGAFSPEFGITQGEFEKLVSSAAGKWSEVARKELFVYKPEARLTVNLMYDERQAAVYKNQVLEKEINKTRTSAENIKAEYKALEIALAKNSAAYDSALAAYNKSQAAYNADVDYWNARGGARASEYQKLIAKKNALAMEAASLETRRQSINWEVQTVNALIAEYNSLVANANQDINTINETAGNEFDAGEYKVDKMGKRINIYEFADEAELMRVLTHEFGHALGLEHVSNKDSIMYYLNQSQNTLLTAEDKAAIRKLCSIK